MADDTCYEDEQNLSDIKVNIVKPGVQEALNLLTEWNLEELQETFLEHDMTIRSMECLAYTEMCELIPKIGPRSVFKSMLNQWKESKNNSSNSVVKLNAPQITIVHCEPQESPEKHPSFDPLSSSNPKRKQHSQLLKPAASAIKQCKLSIKSDNDLLQNSKSKFLYNDAEDDDYDEEEIEEITQDSINDNTSDFDIPDDEWNNMNEYGSDEKKPKVRAKRTKIGNLSSDDIIHNLSMTKIKIDYQDWDGKPLNVKKLLESEEKGRNAFEFYKEHDTLDSRNRKAIIHILIHAVVERRIRNYMDMLHNIKNQLVKLFPSIPGEQFLKLGNSSNGSRHRGSLFLRYCNYTRRLKRLGVWTNPNFLQLELD